MRCNGFNNTMSPWRSTDVPPDFWERPATKKIPTLDDMELLLEAIEFADDSENDAFISKFDAATDADWERISEWFLDNWLSIIKQVSIASQDVMVEFSEKYELDYGLTNKEQW